jgi:3',5'-cyclic AMP phosphodiesterase CpdA
MTSRGTHAVPGWSAILRAGPALACASLFLGVLACACQRGDDAFRVLPYLQGPAPDAVTVLWFSHDARPGQLSYRRPGARGWRTHTSAPERADALASDGAAGRAPYRHRLRLAGLDPDTVYEYVVEQGGSRVRARFRTAPGPASRRPLRFIALADCEAEPESTGKHAPWPDPAGARPGRRYLVDQTQGLADNLAVVRGRAPDLVAIAGDLVEAGGEQEDWDELWRQLGHVAGLAAHVPIVAAPGNHEYYAGKQRGGYDQPASDAAIQRFLAYFEPDHASGSARRVHATHRGRYFRLDYGPVTFLVLDVANASPHRSARDTNFFLRGEADEGGGTAPDLGPGSAQRAWLEAELRDAQATAAFTFVVLHHVPYSVGPHGWPPGAGPLGGLGNGFDPQSGVPVRALVPLFLRYGVDAVLAGHDEMFERSELPGSERLPDGTDRPHTLQVYDVGVCGDGLRGPEPGLDNPYQKFLAHRDAPEVWQDGVLVDGGKHYGHLEIDVTPRPGGWQAVLEPVYVLPRTPARGPARRVYDDVVMLDRADQR